MVGTISHIARREQQTIPWVSQLYPQCCLGIQPFSLWLLRACHMPGSVRALGMQSYDMGPCSGGQRSEAVMET